MIESFRCKETQKIFHRKYSRIFPFDIQKRAYRKLVMLHSAMTLYDMKIPPSNCLEALAGKRKGKYSIRINSQWRLCFRWTESSAKDVEIIDYH